MRASLRAALAWLVLSSCSHEAPPERVPSLADFADFQTWTRTSIPTDEAYLHAVYSNALADQRVFDASGRDQGAPWALGTAFVRAEESGPPQAWLLHGLARRGGDFNQGLATGWEFFGLFIDEHGAPQLIWRGEHPPLSAGYIGPDTGVADVGPNGLPDGDCNGCHRDPDAVIPFR